MMIDIKLFHFENIIVWGYASGFSINKEWLMTGDGKLLLDLPESNRAAISAGRCSSYANKKREERGGAG